MQLEVARGARKLDVQTLQADKRKYLEQRQAALRAVEAARESALARFDAEIEQRRKQIAHLEAELKDTERTQKEAEEGRPKRPRSK